MLFTDCLTVLCMSIKDVSACGEPDVQFHTMSGNPALILTVKVTGHFAYGTLRLLDSSPTVWSFRLLVISPTRHFAYCLDSSPIDITHLNLFYSGSLVGKMKSNLLANCPGSRRNV